MIKSPPNIFYDKKHKNLAFVVAVTDFYINELHKNWDKLKDWDICVLTNRPDEFKHAFYVEEYKDFIFSYVHTITFALRSSIKFKREGFLIDADDLEKLTEEFCNNHHVYNNIHAAEYWPTSMKEVKKTELGLNLQRYATEVDIDILELNPISERVIYFPYSPRLVDVLYEVERTKPIMEYTSLFNHDFGYIGNGPGLALSLALKRHGMEVQIFENNPFK